MAVASGAAGALAFPEPGWWWWAPLFPVPILLACRSASGLREAARHAWLGGAAFFIATHHWAIPSVTIFIVPLGLLLGALWAPIGAIAWMTMRPPVTGRRLAAAVLLVPCAWVAVELVRSWDRLGGPWALLGASQWNNRPLLALAALGGVWLVSFVVAVVATAITVAVAPGTASPVRALAVGTGLFVAVACVGGVTLRPAPTPAGGVRAAGVQPGVIRDPDRRFAASEALTRTLLGEPIDLVAWGESSIGFDPDARPDYLDRVTDLARDLSAPLLVNVDGRPAVGGIFKTSVLVGTDGALALYDKTRLVPFGEYIPMRPVLGWITRLTSAADVDRQNGDGLVTVVAAGAGPQGRELRLGPLICFESAFPDLARAHAAEGVDLIVLQTATTTVEGTWAQAQHASLAAVRAAETGRPVVHAALSGVSAVFDAEGRRLAWFEGEGVYAVDVPLVEGTTPFVRFGNWVPVTALVVLVGAGLSALTRPRKWRSPAHPISSDSRPRT